MYIYIHCFIMRKQLNTAGWILLALTEEHNCFHFISTGSDTTNKTRGETIKLID